MATDKPDEPFTQNLKVGQESQGQRRQPVKSPRALPRRRAKLQPPSYEEAQQCRCAEAIIQELDAQMQTECKILFVNADNTRVTETDSGPDEPGDGMACLSKREQMKLLDAVKRLQEEQDSLKSKLNEHDKHFKTFMDRQASIRHTLRRKANTGTASTNTKSAFPWESFRDGQRYGEDSVEDVNMYVQIEQLYVNLCKIHMPTNANDLKWMLDMQQVKPPMLCTKDDIGAYPDRFSKRIDSDGYWNITSVQENMALQSENEELKQKVRELEDMLNRLTPNVKQKSPLPTISTGPWSCNFGPSNLQNVNQLKPVDVDLKRGPSVPATDSEYSVVAGCPVQIHPGLGTVNPLEMTFEWSISNYSGKFEMESKGRDLKTLSKPFYLNHCGYLAQLVVYLNGNSSGQGRCMSVFLRIIKGSYDQHHHWPVRLSFVVAMVNQVEGRQQSLKGDRISEFEFRKPTGWSDDSCDCWGFIEFVPHSMIAQRRYISNDSILMEVKLKIM